MTYTMLTNIKYSLSVLLVCFIVTTAYGDVFSDAERGNPVAQFELGKMYAEGEGVPQDDKKAIEWLEKASNQNNDDAQLYLGWMYNKGRDGRPESNNVFTFISDGEFNFLKAKYGFSDSENDLLSKTTYNVNKEIAKYWYKKSADLGNKQAMVNLGYTLIEGGRGHASEAATWFEKAASSGYSRAQYALGTLYDGTKNGLYSNEFHYIRDNSKAKQWYEKAAMQGHAEAQFHLGQLYAWGQGVRQDDEQAKLWYEKAAAQDNTDAQLALAKLYEEGKGMLFSSKSTAKEWYGKACDHGSQEGCDNFKRLKEKSFLW